MDLKTIKNRIRDGLITSLDEFERDIFLMFANATLFNEPGSDVYEQAQAVSFGFCLVLKAQYFKERF